MQTIKQLVTAALGLSLNLNARTFLIQSSDQGPSLTVTLTDAAGTRYPVSGVGVGFKCSPAAGFVKVEITSMVDTNVQFIVTDGEVDIQNNQTVTQISNGNANPVPVNIVGGVNLSASNVGINNTTANPVPVSMVSEPGAPFAVTLQPAGATVTDQATVPVSNAGAALIAAGARKALRVRNAGAGLLALTGAAATTLAQAAIVLNPGDVWNETECPGAAWFAVSDSATTAALQVIA